MKKNVKIAFVEARYESFYGAQRSMYTLITNLDFTQFKPVVVTTAEGELADRFRREGIQVHIIPLAPIANEFGKQILHYSLIKKAYVLKEILKYNFRVHRWLNNSEVDIVYANDLRALLQVGIAARLQGLPLIWYVRGDERIGTLHHLGVSLATRVVTIADGVRRAFSKKELERFSLKFTTLYTGFDTEQYICDDSTRYDTRMKLGIKSDAIVIGLVGSITPRKGHDLLVKAAQIIVQENNNVCFLIVGDTPQGYEEYRNYIQSEINKFGLTSHFFWSGYTDKIKSMYSAMDVLVLPSRSEGLPRTIIEALAAGLPVIATDVGGVGEIITSDELGFVVKSENYIELVNAVNKTLKEIMKTELRQKRYKYIKERFSINSYVEGFTKIVERELKGT